MTWKQKLTSHLLTEIYPKRRCKLHRNSQAPIKYSILCSENFGFEFFPPSFFLFLYGKSKISKNDSSISTYNRNVLMQTWAFHTYKAMCKIWDLLSKRKLVKMQFFRITTTISSMEMLKNNKKISESVSASSSSLRDSRMEHKE